jgi:hypothetical protein
MTIPAGLPDLPTVPALLRAALAGDEEGAAAIVATTDRLSLIFALAAWINVMRGGADFGETARYDEYLAMVQREMASDEAE